MHICMHCDVMENMEDLEEPQCNICGSTMYPINPKTDNKEDSCKPKTKRKK